MADPFIGEIVMFGGNFAPRNWALCDGQLLSINSNSALFSILGTTYGGDGVSSFGLPDLRGRVPMHAGNGPGLTPRHLGQKGGSETVTLTSNEIPPHGHSLNANSSFGSSPSPDGQNFARLSSGSLYSPNAVNTTLKSDSIGHAGGGQSHNNMQPYQCVNFIIALQGVYPSRS